MESIAVSTFKATCLSVLERVRRTGRPVQVTKFGKPLAEVGPPRKAFTKRAWLGCMASSGRLVGDVVSPATDAEEWDALRR
jgi:prevent-host-death family protein